MINLNQLVQNANGMAPLPASTVRLSQIVCEPKSHMNEVIELISLDQSLTVKLLGAANSAASASRVSVGTVQEAVMRLGTAQVMALAVASSARKLLEAPVGEYGYSEGGLWRHSVAAAVAAEILPLHLRTEVPRETFTAALLHDIGKLVMARFLSAEVLHFLREARERGHVSEMQAETQILQVHHAELGGIIAQRWKLPQRVVQGIIYHHAPEQSADGIAYLTCLANLLAHDVEAELDRSEHELVIPPDVTEQLALTPDLVEKLRASVESRYEQISQRYMAS
jgi:putative nucleotidyltransferase with HDIG domain